MGGTLAFPESQQGGAGLEAPAAEVVQEGLQQVCVPRPLQARPQVLADLIVKLHNPAADVMILADALCLVCTMQVSALDSLLGATIVCRLEVLALSIVLCDSN